MSRSGESQSENRRSLDSTVSRLPGSPDSAANKAKLKQSVTFNLPPDYVLDQELNSRNTTPTSFLWPTTSDGTPTTTTNQNVADGDDADDDEEQDRPSLPRLVSTTSWRSRVQNKTLELRKLFSLPPTEHLINDYMCALKKKVLLQGRLYVFSTRLCFYCSLFGYTKIKVIKISDIDTIAKKKNVGFPNSILITLKDGKREFFTSFISREDAYTLMQSLWMEEHGVTSPTTATSSSSSIIHINNRKEQPPTSPRSPIVMSPTTAAAAVATKFIRGLSSVGRSSSSSLKKTPSARKGTTTATKKTAAAQSTTGSIANGGDDISSPTSSTDSVPLELRPSYGFLDGSAFNDAGSGAEDGSSSSNEEDNDNNSADEDVVSGIAEFTDISDQQCKTEFKEIAGFKSSIGGGGLHPGLSIPAPSPHPDAVLTLKRRLPGCTPEMYWCLVLSNSSAAFFSQFHERRGDSNVKISSWQRHEQVGMVRDVSFVYEVKSRMGPPVTLCHQSQRYQMYQGHHLVFETTQVMPDIPYGDHFQVLARWDITPYDDHDDETEEEESSGTSDSRTGSRNSISEGEDFGKKGGGCHIEVRLRIPFGKNTVWKKYIESSALQTATESASIFISLVEEKLAEKRGKLCVLQNGGGREGGREGKRLENRNGDVSHHSTFQVLPSASVLSLPSGEEEEEVGSKTGKNRGIVLVSPSLYGNDDDDEGWERMLKNSPEDVKLRVQDLRNMLAAMKQQQQGQVSKWWKVLAVFNIVIIIVNLLFIVVS